MDEHTKNLILSKLEAAQEEIDTAVFLIEKQKNRTAINTLYVAANHAIRSLIVSKNFSSREPVEITAFLQKNIIPENIIDTRQLELYKHLLEYKLRQEYDVTFKPELPEINIFLDEVRNLVDTVKNYFFK